MLDKKLQYVNKIKQSYVKYLEEVKDGHVLQHMYTRVDVETKIFKNRVRELDPYFDFQDKIQPTLKVIGAGKEQRSKIQENKIKQLKQQIKDMKVTMSQNLRHKCNELADLERMNKKTRLKLKNKKDCQHADVTSVRDTTSADAPCNYGSKKEDFHKTKSDAPMDKREDASSIAECQEEQTKGLEINLENCVDIQQFIF